MGLTCRGRGGREKGRSLCSLGNFFLFEYVTRQWLGWVRMCKDGLG